MIKIVLFFCAFNLFITNLYAGQSASDIAKALEERLADALDFQDNNERLEDGSPLWLMLYVRPGQSKNFPNYLAKAFRVGHPDKPFANVSNISSKNTFFMKKDSPWSIQYNGIGRMYFYREKNFKKIWKIISSKSDYPKKLTFGSTNNASNCLCSPTRPSCTVSTCGKRERIGSIKFDPGVVFFTKKNFKGQNSLLTPLTMTTSSISSGQTVCLPVRDSKIRTASSMHFDASIKEVHLFKANNCKGAKSWYSWQKQHGTVHTISPYVQNRIRSIKIVFKNSFDL